MMKGFWFYKYKILTEIDFAREFNLTFTYPLFYILRVMRKIEKYIHTNPFEFENQKQSADPSAAFQPNQFPLIIFSDICTRYLVLRHLPIRDKLLKNATSELPNALGIAESR